MEILSVLIVIIILIATVVIIIWVDSDEVRGIVSGVFIIFMIILTTNIIENICQENLINSLIKDNKIEYCINKKTGEMYLKFNDTTLKNTNKLIYK